MQRPVFGSNRSRSFQLILYLQESRFTLRTNEMCTPKRRCDPEHSKQQKHPIFPVPGGAPGGGLIKDAQVGFLSGQSEQIWFSGRSIKTLSRFFNAFWSAMIACVFLNDDEDKRWYLYREKESKLGGGYPINSK